MAKISMEDLHINKIKLGIKSIGKGIKTPKDANLSNSFSKLKALNKGMYDDLMNDYRATLYGIPLA